MITKIKKYLRYAYIQWCRRQLMLIRNHDLLLMPENKHNMGWLL